MHEIGHQYVSVNNTRVWFTGELKFLQIKGIICGLGKNGFAIIAAWNEVLRLPRQDIPGGVEPSPILAHGAM
jgi:hypothetical protein